MTTVEASPHLYRVSVLATSLLRMWRGWRVLFPVVIINALVQGLLVFSGVLPYLSLAFVVLAALSLAALSLSFSLIAATMLQASTGPVSVQEVLAVTRRRWLPLLAWSIGLAVVITVGLALYVLPGLLLLAITPYLLLAVVDGQPRPLAVNFAVLRARWARSLVTVVVVSAVCLVMWLLSALDGFFVTGFGGALIGWLVIGLVSGWLICAWALVYRSVMDGHRGP